MVQAVRETVEVAPLNPKGHPDWTGRQLRDYLKETGTGGSRIAILDEWLLKRPDVSGKQLLEQMNAYPMFTGINNGTGMKAGRAIYGTAYTPTLAAASSAIDELESSREKVVNLETHIRGLENTNSSHIKELANLRTHNAQLRDENSALKIANDKLEHESKDGAKLLKELEELKAENAKLKAPPAKKQ